MSLWPVILISFSVLGCSMFGSKDVSGRSLDPQKKLAQEQELKKAQNEQDQLHFQASLELFQKFQNDHLDSPFFYQAQIGQAKSLEALGKWSEAAALYRSTVESTRKYQPELTAISLYHLSFCYEALGEETKVYASLLDAEKLKDKLTIEISKAELPARMAASLFRMGRLKDSSLKITEAEQGLGELKAMKEKDISHEWLARTYFQMGLISTNQLSMENFRPSLDTLKIVQIFSLRAVEEADSKWSPLAAETLSSTYKDLSSLVDQVPLNRSLDRGVAVREQQETKFQMAVQILESMEKLKSLRITTDKESDLLTKLYASLSPVEKKLVDVLEENPLQNELTPESQKYQNLKKNIIMKSKPLFPSEKAHVVPVDQGEDRK